MVSQKSGSFIGAHVENSSYDKFEFQIDGGTLGAEFVGNSGQNYGVIDMPGEPSNAQFITEAVSGRNTMTRRCNRIKATNGVAVTADTGGATAVSSGSFQMLAGETPRVTLFTSYVKDVIVGDVAITLYKLLG